jgi:hypothetical protein
VTFVVATRCDPRRVPCRRPPRPRDGCARGNGREGSTSRSCLRVLSPPRDRSRDARAADSARPLRRQTCTAVAIALEDRAAQAGGNPAPAIRRRAGVRACPSRRGQRDQPPGRPRYETTRASARSAPQNPSTPKLRENRVKRAADITHFRCRRCRPRTATSSPLARCAGARCATRRETRAANRARTKAVQQLARSPAQSSRMSRHRSESAAAISHIPAPRYYESRVAAAEGVDHGQQTTELVVRHRRGTREAVLDGLSWPVAS